MQNAERELSEIYNFKIQVDFVGFVVLILLALVMAFVVIAIFRVRYLRHSNKKMKAESEHISLI